jgi:hypothetical protein
MRTDHEAEVYRLHLTYLVAAKEAMFDHGDTYAEIVYGLRNPLMAWLRTASATQIERLARSKQMVFALRMPSGTAGERMLASVGTEPSATQIERLTRLHAMGVMASGGGDDDPQI